MVRVLQFTAQDMTVRKLLLPLIDRLTAEGYEVVSACTPGRHTPELTAQGYALRPVWVDRQITPTGNLRTVRQLQGLLRRERFDIVHVHTPVAAALGRVAARLAGTPVVMYTAHGFYFHEHMKWWAKSACVGVEKLLGRTATDMLLLQSKEDAATAVTEGICRPERVTWIGNGVNIRQFTPGPASPQAKSSFGLPPGAPVVGFVGRLVAEKGAFELLEAFQQALPSIPDLHLLVVGDAQSGDRDRKTGELLRSMLDTPELARRVVMPGYVDDIAQVMQAVDLFALPSYREGMPRSIIEAMASGKPVVATNIRGCREEVVHGVTGLLVPVRDSQALAEAMVQVLANPDSARRMGQEGRKRAEALFDEDQVLDRQVQVYQQLVTERLLRQVPSGSAT